MSETTMSEYIKGFDHGCDYIVAEIERYMKEHANTEQVLAPLLRVLRGTDNLGKVPTKKFAQTLTLSYDSHHCNVAGLTGESK